MNFAGLKKLRGKQVSLWPRPLVWPGYGLAEMQWLVNRVDATARVVELLAPSGHIFDAGDVIHHFQKAGNTLVLAARVIIKGNEIIVEPRPWGETKTFTQLVGEALLRGAKRPF